jgi:predicted amidohydrolase YtcJ
LTGRVTDLARNAIERVGTRRTFTPEQREQRDRDGLAFISKQFVRYGLTSVHHEGGNLRALQEVRSRGELLHRVSFEISGNVLESMITSGITNGFRRRMDSVVATRLQLPQPSGGRPIRDRFVDLFAKKGPASYSIRFETAHWPFLGLRSVQGVRKSTGPTP